MAQPLGAITLALLTHLYIALGHEQMRMAARRIQQIEQAGDAILNLLPEESQNFANVYHGRLPVIGLSQQGTLNDDDAARLARMEATYRRLWVLPTDGLPEQSGWERTLRLNDFLLLDTRLGDSQGQRWPSTQWPQRRRYPKPGWAPSLVIRRWPGAAIDADNGWIRLDGYALTSNTKPGAELLLVLRWESLQRVQNNYQVFVHLLNAHGEKLAQRDGQPVQWLRPTSSWQPGEKIIDRYGLLLPDDLPAGGYTIAVGLYDPVSGQRLPVSAGPRDYAIEMGPVQVGAVGGRCISRSGYAQLAWRRHAINAEGMIPRSSHFEFRDARLSPAQALPAAKARACCCSCCCSSCSSLWWTVTTTKIRRPPPPPAPTAAAPPPRRPRRSHRRRSPPPTPPPPRRWRRHRRRPRSQPPSRHRGIGQRHARRLCPPDGRCCHRLPNRIEYRSRRLSKSGTKDGLPCPASGL